MDERSAQEIFDLQNCMHKMNTITVSLKELLLHHKSNKFQVKKHVPHLKIAITHKLLIFSNLKTYAREIYRVSTELCHSIMS